MEIVDVIDSNSDLIKELTALWRHSVAQTHTFLTVKDIDEIENYVPQALKKVKHLIVAKNKNSYLGFIGIEQHRLEMLFLDPQYIGQGIGRQLLDFVKQKNHRLQLTVYEKNTSAVAFYKQNGFTILSDQTDLATGEKEFLMQWKT